MTEKPPTEAELKAAFAVIERAEKHVKSLADAAGIPNATVYIHGGNYGAPGVGIRCNRRLFLSHSGKRNLEGTNFLYRNVTAELDKIKKWLMPDVA